MLQSTLRPLSRRLLAVCAACGLLAGPVPLASANQTLFYQVFDGANDAEEGPGGAMDVGSSDLELMYDGDDRQLVGIRFEGIDLPRGTPILEAYLQFATDEDDKNEPTFDVQIYAEAADDAVAFSEESYDISDRDRTAAMVRWAGIPEWTVEHEAGPDQQTPDLAALVQEVLDRDAWEQGNAIVFILEGEGVRSAESYEGSIGDVEVADLAPKLVIRAASTEVYRVRAGNDDAEEGDDGPGVLDIGSSDLEITEDHLGTPQTIGLRFQDVTIPRGADIVSAYIQFAVDEGDKTADPFEVTITGEAIGDPAPYADEDYNISSRPRTSASVQWQNAPAWTTVHEAGPDQRTPDVSAIVAELIARDDWAEGNAMAFVLEGIGRRSAESYDGTSILAPALHVTFVGEQTTPSADKIRLSWTDDPTTTMTVIWDQTRGSGAEVYYDTYEAAEGCSTDPADYDSVQAPKRVQPYLGMNNHVATLTGLTPDTDYRFLVVDSEGITSECSWFRTAPDVPKPFTYITGGDTKSSGEPLEAGRLSNRMVAKLRPLFVFFTGDFNSGDGTNPQSWQTWLTDWSELTRSEDGRMYPIVAVHGNHEDGDFEVLYQLFDSGNQDPAQLANYSYYSLSFGGDLLHVINLNSQLFLNEKYDAHDKQTAWLEQDLMDHRDFTFKIAGAHKPIRPHTASKRENDFMLEWAELFDTYGLTIFNESDTHVHAYTFPLRRSDAPGNVMGFVRDDDNGVLYVGEGSWGAFPRATNDDKSWTLHSASVNQLKWVHVFPAEGTEPARMDLRTVLTGRYENGGLVSYVDGVEALTEDDLFTEPDGISLVETPFYGTVLEVPFQAVSGEPPLAPTALTGEATSFTDIRLSWANNEEPRNVSGLEVWRREGAEDWVLVQGGLDAGTDSFEDSFLKDGTDYTYRVRAVNIFGSSGWSNEVLVPTPEDKRLRVTLQEGVDGYTGNRVVVIASASPDTTHTRDEVSIDGSTSDYGGSGVSQGLIRFDGVFGAGGIPANAVVSQAELRFFTTSSASGPVGLFRMLQPWDGTATWNSVAGGIQNDGVEAAVDADEAFSSIQSGVPLIFDVTDTVKAWAAGAANHGWAIINFNTDGWDFPTETGPTPEERPQLTVYYTVAGDVDGNGVVDRADVAALRPYLRQPADACPACDLNGDGRISIHDARMLARMAR